MFTIRPAAKNALNGNGHKNGNGQGKGHNNGNGHSNASGSSKGGKIETVLGPGIHYKGTLTGSAGVRIEGAFDGTITIKGPVVIAEGAKVTAEIQASAVSVGGSLKGNITAGKVEILSTGRIWGDLVTAAFATEEGSFLRGQVTMQEEAPLPAESRPAGRAGEAQVAPTQPHIPVAS